MTANDQIDEFEKILSQCDPVQCPLDHEFVPGLYIRTIYMPKGTWITSMIHNTTHPYFVLKGKVKVYSDTNGVEVIQAPHKGITTPGTRRVLFIEEDCIWVTTHPTDVVPESTDRKHIMEAVDKVCDQIIEKRENPLLGGMAKNNVIVKLLDNEN